LLELLLVYALFGGSNAARIITTVVFGVSLLFSLTSVLTRQPGALFAWVTGLVDVIVLVGLWGTPGAAEFFDSGRAPSARAAAPVPPPPRL
jgi:low temperature requirement protein LtrA